MKKRFAAAALSVLIICVLSFAAYAENTDTALSFSDVTPSDWFYADVLYAAEKGLLSGTGNGRFTPNGKTTRAMAVTVLWRLDGKPASPKAAFSDVKEGQYFFDAVSWASENKIVNGYDSSRFAPDDTVTREQLVSILFRYAGYKGNDTSDKADLGVYADAGQISAYAKDSMAWAVKAGLINGVSATALAPKGTATRSQIAAIFVRFSKMLSSQIDNNGNETATAPAAGGTAQTPGQSSGQSTEHNTASGSSSSSSSSGGAQTEGASISVGKVSAKPGDRGVKVAVSVSGNPGILGMKINLEYDESALKLSGAASGSAFKALDFTPSKVLNSGCTFLWDGVELKSGDISDGDILILEFDVLSGANAGVYPVTVSYKNGDIVDNGLKRVSPAIQNGAITIG